MSSLDEQTTTIPPAAAIPSLDEQTTVDPLTAAIPSLDEEEEARKKNERKRSRRDRMLHAELMGEDIMDIYLSTEPLCLSHHHTTEEVDDNRKEPKLRRFIDHEEDIRNPCFIDRGLHGVVVSADIKGTRYALKIFKQWEQPGPLYYPIQLAKYITPLACECRAFARLDARSENGTWAVRCYGWMKLTDEHFKVLGTVIGTSGLSRWAVVKEYIPIPTDPSHIQTIFESFKIAEEAEIMPQDVRIENYRGSKIVDLSSTLTAPSPGWSDYWYDWFYKESTRCVFRWFKDDE